jgi:hypothetical protein
MTPVSEVNEERRSARGVLIYLVLMVVILIGSLWYAIANAQTARTATITFTRPTHYVDGTPIPAGTVLTYKVLQGARGSTNKPQVATITATATTINSGLQPGETCWQLITVANGVDSAVSNEGCKTFAWPATEPVTITVT